MRWPRPTSEKGPSLGHGYTYTGRGPVREPFEPGLHPDRTWSSGSVGSARVPDKCEGGT